MKCIQCGKTVEGKTAVLCDECFRKKHTCFKSFTEHTLLICANCGSYKYQNQWKPRKGKNYEEGESEAVKEATLHYCQFIFQPQAVDLDIHLLDEHGSVKKGTATLRTESKIDGQKLIEEFELALKVKKSTCDQCGKIKTEYFEGILQLRGDKKDALQKAHDFVLADIEVAGKKGIFITKWDEVTGGVDYYYTRQQYLPIIMHKLADKFGATAKTHPELYSKNRQTSKDVYRVNASVRLPAYELGTLIRYHKRMYQILKIAKQVSALDLLTHKRFTIDEIADIEVLLEPPAFVKVQVTKWYPHIEILHPETFQSVTVENSVDASKEVSKEIKEVLVAIVENSVWIVEKI